MNQPGNFNWLCVLILCSPIIILFGIQIFKLYFCFFKCRKRKQSLFLKRAEELTSLINENTGRLKDGISLTKYKKAIKKEKIAYRKLLNC